VVVTVTGSLAVPPLGGAAVSTATATCPAGHPNAIGGGVSGTNPGFLLTDQPVGGSTSTPANGWQGALSVNSGTTETTTVWVICSS
jgi:hypothetical protein